MFLRARPDPANILTSDQIGRLVFKGLEELHQLLGTSTGVTAGASYHPATIRHERALQLSPGRADQPQISSTPSHAFRHSLWLVCEL